MNECRYCHYRFEDAEALEDHLQYVLRYTPVLCAA